MKSTSLNASKGIGHCIYTDIHILMEDNEKLKKALDDIFKSINDSISKNEKVDLDYINKTYERIAKCTQKI